MPQLDQCKDNVEASTEDEIAEKSPFFFNRKPFVDQNNSNDAGNHDGLLDINGKVPQSEIKTTWADVRRRAQKKE